MQFLVKVKVLFATLFGAGAGAKLLQSCPTLCNPMDYIACQAPSLARILQARILEWVVISSSRGSSLPRDGTYVSCGSCTAASSSSLSRTQLSD